MTDPRTDAAREWVYAKTMQYGKEFDYDLDDARHLALIDYIVELEKRLEVERDIK